MKSLLIVSAAAVLGLAGAAYAQPMPSTPAVPATPATPPLPDSPATATPTMPATSETPAPPEAPAPPEPPAPPAASPDTGVAAVPAAGAQASSATAASSNTSATAGRPSTSTYLGAGLQVKDSTGANIGRITHLTVSGSDTMATIHIGRRDVTVPLSTLHLDGRYAVSTQTRADLEGQPAAAPNP